MIEGLVRRSRFWTVVWLLLTAAQKRAAGRRAVQRQRFRRRAGNRAGDWNGLGFFLIIFLLAVFNIGAAFLINNSVRVAQYDAAEQNGRIGVDQDFYSKVSGLEQFGYSRTNISQALTPSYQAEAHHLARRYGGDERAIAAQLRTSIRRDGTRDLVREDVAAPGLAGLPRSGAVASVLGSLFLLGWSLILVFQDEGLALDPLRRRHPMWEFLFSHPVPAGAVFLAEMLSPIVANPFYLGAPLLPGILYGFVYGPGLGLIAIGVIGIPITVAVAFLSKALEIGIMLRFSPRSRGAMLGLMGTVSLSAIIIGPLLLSPSNVTFVAGVVQPLTVIPWPWLGMFLGQQADGKFSFLFGMLTCWLGSGLTLAAAMQFSMFAARQGLGGTAGKTKPISQIGRWRAAGFGQHALYRKEFLWIMRDRNALVQAVLFPLLFASFQFVNFRNNLAHGAIAWNTLCGMAILFGVYFLNILGPKALAAEGSALWMTLTWPWGLENLLRAKARLWSLITTVAVGLVLGYTAFLFPANAWKIALIGVGWFLFARSLALKTVTLATMPSESGEAQKIPAGRRWATQLGTSTFAIGVLTQQWNLAVVGLVYSTLTAAAMWQNFRARLPFFYDPWSEDVPPPPTLMNAMVAVSILLDLSVAVAALLVPFVNRDMVAMVRPVSYLVSAVIVAAGVTKFLAARGVRQSQIWSWPQPEHSASWHFLYFRTPGRRGFVNALLLGAGGGLVLGALALFYLAILYHVPETASFLKHAAAQTAAIPHARLGLFITGVFVAPFIEEYLFRGLLYRALDREWGGWRAIVGSAVFFASYHPTLAWLPVGLVGIANALIFKKTGRLAPAIALHMVYNAVVISGASFWS